MDDFRRYAAKREDGQDAQSVYRAARADGLDTPACIRMLRGLFGCSLAEAKATMSAADGAASLDETQSRIAEELDR